MNLRLVPLFSLLAAALSVTAARTAQAQDHLVIDSVDGDKAVIIFTDKNERQAKKGDDVQFWDVVQTSRRSSIKLRYPDGSVVVVGRDTKFTVQPKQQGTQYNQLDWGQVRAQVTKEDNPSPKAPPRFVIRTKTATMGVRGTDFVAGFDAQSGQASLHTIEGTVDMAADESKVMSWQGTPITAGHDASLNTTSQAIAVGSFAPQAYKEKMKTEQPELVALADRPADSSENVPTSTATPSPSKEEEKLDVNAGLKILRFRVGAVSLLQDVGQGTGVQYTTAALSWNPSLSVWGPFSAVGNAGGFLLKNASTSSSFPVFKVGAFLNLHALGGFHLQAGTGIEIWKTDQTGTLTSPYAMAGLVWEFAPGRWIDTIYAGYSVLIANNYSSGQPNEASAGVGLRF